MAAFKPDFRGLNSYLGINGGGIPLRINFEAFLDRESIYKMIGRERARALTRAGLKVKQAAAKSIKKMGMAKPLLKVQQTYGAMSLAEISRLQGASAERQGIRRDSAGRFLQGSGGLRSIDGQITESDRRKVLERLAEIRARSPSAPGTPPHTHTGMLRNNIAFAYDKTSESVVIGGFMSGGAWLMSLHEFGGSIRQTAWTWVPRYPNPKYGILLWLAPNRSPRQSQKWQPTSLSRTAQFPARPYMERALHKCVRDGSVVGSFRIGGLGR